MLENLKGNDTMKPSKYNVITEDKHKHGYFLIANVLSGALVRVDSTTYKKISKLFKKSCISPNCEDKNLVSFLADNGFIISESFNELEFLKNLHYEARKGRKALGLGIAPTLNCNFACVYCYQHHLPIDLNKEIEEGIFEYVKKNILGREILYINWFGGEPLLGLKTIERLSNTFIDICQRNGCDYDATITTNGYLLTKSVAKTLNRCGIKEVQVTIDGPPQIHDKRRSLISGKGTFEKILTNVITSADLFNEFIIRINIDKFNADTIQQLLDILEPINNMITLAFRPATSPESPEKPTNFSLPDSEYLSLEDHLIDIAKQKGFGVIIGYAIPGTSFCSAYQRNAVMVDPYGDVHLCPVCVGRRKYRYGILDKNGNIINDGGIQSEWYAYNVFDDPECVECLAFPLCMGGCLWYLKVPKAGSQRCVLKNKLVERIGDDYILNKFLSK